MTRTLLATTVTTRKKRTKTFGFPDRNEAVALNYCEPVSAGITRGFNSSITNPNRQKLDCCPHRITPGITNDGGYPFDSMGFPLRIEECSPTDFPLGMPPHGGSLSPTTVCSRIRIHTIPSSNDSISFRFVSPPGMDGCMHAFMQEFQPPSF